jgi:phosphoglycerate kinase
MTNRSIALLANLKFDMEETAHDEQFSQQLASLADIYADDGFSSPHRA